MGVEISFSRFQAYQRCPWLYNLVYNENWRSGPSHNGALGQSMHRTLEAYLSPENTTFDIETLMEVYDQNWMNEGFKSPQETLDAYDQGRKMLEVFFEVDKKRTSKVLATEKEFAISLTPAINFRGTVDRIDQNRDGSIDIIEYKTHGLKWNTERVANDLQMTLYVLGIQEAMNVDRINAKYYFLSTGMLIETTRTIDQLAEARILLLDIAEKIQKKEFSPNHNYCFKCEFGKRCSNFKEGADSK